MYLFLSILFSWFYKLKSFFRLALSCRHYFICLWITRIYARLIIIRTTRSYPSTTINTGTPENILLGSRLVCYARITYLRDTINLLKQNMKTNPQKSLMPSTTINTETPENILLGSRSWSISRITYFVA
jgi:hypothetical protein